MTATDLGPFWVSRLAVTTTVVAVDDDDDVDSRQWWTESGACECVCGGDGEDIGRRQGNTKAANCVNEWCQWDIN